MVISTNVPSTNVPLPVRCAFTGRCVRAKRNLVTSITSNTPNEHYRLSISSEVLPTRRTAMNYRIVSLGVIMLAAVSATSFEAAARSGGGMGGGGSMGSMSRGGGSMASISRVPTARVVVRDHRATATGEKKVIRAGRNYDKVKGRDVVVVNGKRVPRKI
jgi:hypothetical protein